MGLGYELLMKNRRRNLEIIFHANIFVTIIIVSYEIRIYFLLLYVYIQYTCAPKDCWRGARTHNIQPTAPSSKHTYHNRKKGKRHQTSSRD